MRSSHIRPIGVGQNRRGRQLGLESLENRELFSVDATSMLVAVGDTDGDGIDEVFTGMNAYGNVEIYRSDDGLDLGISNDDGLVLGTPIYNTAHSGPNEWTLQALAVGDVDADGRDELFVAFERSDGGAYIYRSDNGFGIGTKIYESERPELFTIQALAVGDTDGDGNGELYSAFKADYNGDALIYRSDSGLGIGTRIYSSATPGHFTVQALAAGDVDGDGDDELFSAFKANYDGNALIYRSETGNGIGGRIYSSDNPGTFTITALAVGDADDDGAGEFYSAFKAHWNNQARIYRSTSGNGIGPRIYSSNVGSSSPYTVRSLAVGDATSDGQSDLMSTYDRENGSSLLYRSSSGRGIGSKLYQENWSSKHLYLDFDGGTTSPGFDGAPSSVVTPVFDWDNQAGHSFQEQTLIERIRGHVVEDFAPFKVNVTTVRPAYGTVYTVMIGGAGFGSFTNDSGVAHIGGFALGNPAYVFSETIAEINGDPNYAPNTTHPYPECQNTLARFAAWTATTITHEAGHGLGLEHKNEYASNGDGVYRFNQEYSPGDEYFTPIMGNNLSCDRTIWTSSVRPYSSVAGSGTADRMFVGSDDLDILDGEFGRRSDDRVGIGAFGNLEADDLLTASGIIEQVSDEDEFAFHIPLQYDQQLTLELSVEGASIGSNLDSTLTLFAQDGTQYFSVINEPLGQRHSIMTIPNADAGTYLAVVGSAGRFIGDIGTYNISISSTSTGTLNGDLDANGTLDIEDLDLLTAAIHADFAVPLGITSAAHPFDLDGDGSISMADRDEWLTLASAMNLGSGETYQPGDANLDGVVDGQDFIAWHNNRFTSSTAWSDGDFTGDGLVDGQDFVVWHNHSFQAASSDFALTQPDQHKDEPDGIRFVDQLFAVGDLLG